MCRCDDPDLVTSGGFCTGCESIDVLLVAQLGVSTVEIACITYCLSHINIHISLSYH